MTLVTYALTKSNSKIRSEAYQRMMEMRRNDNNEYWSPVPVPPNPKETINIIPYEYPRELYEFDGIATEVSLVK